ncbi:MAG: Gfo/Idh/MocA family oxidoreductase [Candidatus Omnitrophica bacterium]|nr:Gfo/Idh/MocA family oxidoreductase [Candidatus Omnitrophota bacterium]MCB9783540.1 Gfo/Idh/MocA family oxidoreductase [Candidatus Omnitrophota bacterium]
MTLKACLIADTNQGGYGHGFDTAFIGYDEIDFAALADPDEKGRQQAVEKTGVPRSYADYREMLEKEKPDLVAIAPRWPIHHKEYLLAAASVGAHGYLEKPVAVDLAEVDEMVRAIEAKGLKWSVGFQISLAPSFLHAKKLIRDGLIGEVLEVRARGKEDRRAGGEDLIVLGIHLFDALISLFGNPQSCSSFIYTDGEPSQPKDVVHPTEPLGPIVGNRVIANYTFANALPISFQSLQHDQRLDSRFGISVYGSKGILKVLWGFPAPFRHIVNSSWLDLDGEGWKPLPDSPSDQDNLDNHSRNRDVVTDLLAAIREDRLPEVSLQRARWAHEMIQGAFASHVAGATVQFPLENRKHPLIDWS